MAKDQTEEVLIVRNNETGQVGAVTGLNEDGTPKITDPMFVTLEDLVKFKKGQNPLEAFLSNFVRQCKNPTMFGFFKVPADRYDCVGMAMCDFIKDPETNAEILKDFKVDVPQQTQTNIKEQAQENNATDTQAQKPVEEQAAQTEQPKYHAIDESKIDWTMLKKKWGIDRDQLEKSGDLREMLFNRKSALVTITTDVGGKVQQVDARLSFQTDEQGKVNLVPHLIRKYPNLNEEYNGYKFTDEDKENLRTTGNLGKVVDLVDKSTGEVIPSYVSIDRYTHEMYHFPASTLEINDTIGKTKLSNQEIEFLKTGMAIPNKEIIGKNGKTYHATLQVSAERRGVECVRKQRTQKTTQKNENKQEQKAGEGEKTEKRSTWITKDGGIKRLKQWNKIPLTEQQQNDYVSGNVAKLDQMVDDKGKPCTVYLYFNKEKQRPETSFDDPRLATKITPSNESKTQLAVNNDGKTQEATKGVKEPLDKGQTEPKNDEQQKQQRKPKGPKL